MGASHSQSKTKKQRKPGLRYEQRVNAQISKHLRTEKQNSLKINKVLLLGTGDSGKTTVYRQARMLYGKQITHQEYKVHTPRIYENIISRTLSTLIS